MDGPYVEMMEAILWGELHLEMSWWMFAEARL